VDHSELVGLLRDGVRGDGGRWADLGAGEGAFTLALADLLGAGAHITAVDRDAGSLARLGDAMGRKFPARGLDIVVADFRRHLNLANLDGVVMANALHFVSDKRQVLELVWQMLRPGGSLLIVEYGADRGNPWVPHPFSYPTWEKMAAEAGFEETRLLKTIPSRHLGSLYSAASRKPLASGSVT
jgi:ubiquinone/menaquinone biosynthesis C-methylase UbiE